MKNITYILIIISFFSFWACEEVIDIDLNSSTPMIVAEGLVEPGELLTLSLSYSSDYFSNQTSPKIEDATVTVVDDLGNSEALDYIGNGQYVGETIRGRNHGLYTMSFTIDENTYQASAEMNPPTKIEGIYLTEMTMGPHGSGGDEKEYMAEIIIIDQSEDDNYYNLKYHINGELQSDYHLVSDRNVDEYGFISTQPAILFETGDTIKIDLFSINEDTYNYYQQLNDISGDGMSGSTPYNPNSNFGEDVLGFFTAYSSSEFYTIVE